ncbi:DUF2892 domain-containing protein [bacterium]|nr:DUF2892 domain-containing protein [bacterium]
MQLLVDGRERSEFIDEHIPGSVNIPLSEFDSLDAYTPVFSGKSVILICRSGARAQSAKTEFDTRRISARVYSGGILAWKNAGKPTSLQQKKRFSIARQVQIVVGLSIVVTAALAGLGSAHFIALTAGLGAALFLSGLTNTCVLGSFHSRMPWNRR